MQVFSPNSMKEVDAVRQWLHEQINDFDVENKNDKGRLWLGFEKPRFCNGTGRMDVWFTQWNSIELTKMNQDLFTPPDPNNIAGTEFCTVSAGMNRVYDVDCFYDHLYAYAACEANLVAF